MISGVSKQGLVFKCTKSCKDSNRDEGCGLKAGEGNFLSQRPMSTKTMCLYCFECLDDSPCRLEQHVKGNHNEAEMLTLYTFGKHVFLQGIRQFIKCTGRSWSLREKDGRFKCPLC